MRSKAKLEKLKLKVTDKETELDGFIGSLKEKGAEYSKGQDAGALDRYLETMEKTMNSAKNLILAYRGYTKELEKHLSK
jgi:hypothetical protein